MVTLWTSRVVLISSKHTVLPWWAAADRLQHKLVEAFWTFYKQLQLQKTFFPYSSWIKLKNIKGTKHTVVRFPSRRSGEPLGTSLEHVGVNRPDVWNGCFGRLLAGGVIMDQMGISLTYLDLNPHQRCNVSERETKSWKWKQMIFSLGIIGKHKQQEQQSVDSQQILKVTWGWKYAKPDHPSWCFATNQHRPSNDRFCVLYD